MNSDLIWMWQETFVPCYVQLSCNVPKTEKPAKFLIRNRSGAVRDVNPRPPVACWTAHTVS